MSEEVKTEKVQTAQSSTLVKDLAMPVAIVLAGAFVGLGFFFSGGGTQGGGTVNLNAGNQPTNERMSAAELIPMLVDEIDVDRDAFNECFDSQRTDALVQEDFDNAAATGGRGTPWSIVIGPSGKTYPINGAVQAAQVKLILETARNEAGLSATGAETDNVNPITADDYIKGSADAPIKVIEYSDYDCPFCSRFHTTMIDVMEDEEDVAWVYRHFPLVQLHPEAPAVARAAECVGEIAGNDAFWEFTDGYFEARS